MLTQRGPVGGHDLDGVIFGEDFGGRRCQSGVEFGGQQPDSLGRARAKPRGANSAASAELRDRSSAGGSQSSE